MLNDNRESLMKLLDDKEWMNVLNDYFLTSDVTTQQLPQEQSQTGQQKPKQAKVLPEKQRKKLLPFVMRILFGRMLTKKTGHRSKSRIESKHAAVFRFLASSREADLAYFVDLVLLPLQRYNISFENDRNTDTEYLLNRVTFDAKNAMPVRRIRQ